MSSPIPIGMASYAPNFIPDATEPEKKGTLSLTIDGRLRQYKVTVENLASGTTIQAAMHIALQILEKKQVIHTDFIGAKVSSEEVRATYNIQTGPTPGPQTYTIDHNTVTANPYTRRAMTDTTAIAQQLAHRTIAESSERGRGETPPALGRRGSERDPAMRDDRHVSFAGGRDSHSDERAPLASRRPPLTRPSHSHRGPARVQISHAAPTMSELPETGRTSAARPRPRTKKVTKMVTNPSYEDRSQSSRFGRAFGTVSDWVMGVDGNAKTIPTQVNVAIPEDEYDDSIRTV